MTRVTGERLDLLVHGLRVRVTGDWPQVLELLRLDFGWFAEDRLSGDPEVAVEVARRRPSFERFAQAQPAFVTPRNVVFNLDGIQLVDYGGRALAVHDRRADRITIEGQDEELVHEAAYLYVLSRIGSHLDACGTARLHALGLAGEGGATLVMLPSGGGKTSLALRALADEGVKLLSEDTPLLDRRGRAHPFPLRLGVNERDVSLVPPGTPARRVARMEFHPKLLVPVEALEERVERRPQPVVNIVVGRRSLASHSALSPRPKRAALGPLLREGVFGLGVYQGMEFVLQRGLTDVWSQAGVALRRALACLAALAHARVWSLELGRDGEDAWGALSGLVRR